MPLNYLRLVIADRLFGNDSEPWLILLYSQYTLAIYPDLFRYKQ